MFGLDDCNGNGVSDTIDAIGNDCNLNGIPDECDVASGESFDCNGNGVPDECEPVGVQHCYGATNSAGFVALLFAEGSEVVADNCLRLRAFGLPLNKTAWFLMSDLGGVNSALTNSQGTLCVNWPGVIYIAKTKSTGVVKMKLDLKTLVGGYPVLPGETYTFQVLYLDKNPKRTSNTTNALDLTFQ